MKNPIIPVQQLFYNKDSFTPVNWNNIQLCESDLDYESICMFLACGFFLGDSTYSNNIKVLPPASELTSVNGENKIQNYWEWDYQPRDISFKQAVEEFGHLFEKVSKEAVQDDDRVILPLSGGLDSRTQAAALKDHPEVNAYTYQFEEGKPESKYGKAIARAYRFPFHEYTIGKGYLWEAIEELANINGCFSDFTHPRQMGVKNAIGQLGDVFHLGHWGDVLFNDMGVPDDLPFEEQVSMILKKITKPAGLELGQTLWDIWGLEGNLADALKEKVSGLLSEIKIENANARIRAFKSLYWAPRWTSVNLNIFIDEKPMTLPYYSREMCEFIQTVPEAYLAGRQIQMAYLKEKAPELGKIPWQPVDPFNLYNYQQFYAKTYLPLRAWRKTKRIFKEKAMGKPKPIQRNWELQFLGHNNDNKLRSYLFGKCSLNEILPENVVQNFYYKFKYNSSLRYSHAISMLLTLALFTKQNFSK